MNVRLLQTRLKGMGRDPGPIDGMLGPRTYRALFDYMARRPLGERGDLLAKGAVQWLQPYSINTELRLAHWIAQATHETGDFNYMREIWGPTAAQKRYEGRKDLGNTHPGDGAKYLGRGIFQLTGRANYAKYGAELALPLEAEPDLAARPDISVRIACHYWMTHGLNALADKDNLVGITKAINGGTNGLSSRERALNRAKAVLC